MDDRGWQIAAWGIAAAVATVLGVRLLIGCGADPPPPVRIAPQPGHASRSARPASGLRLYVHVAGAVRRPGLYRLSEDARVAAAVHRAGGPTRRAEMDGVNLAARLEDGQQVVVPSRRSAAFVGTTPADTPMSLGAASVEQLEQLDGIGPTLAQRIVEHRLASGGFASLDQLGEVEGIGEKRLEALKEALTP